MKMLNDKNRGKYNKISDSLDFENYKVIRNESKSGRYKQSKINFKKQILKGQ